MKEWIKRKLGIPDLEKRIQQLECLPRFTFEEIVDKMKDTFVVMGGESQILSGNIIEVPPNKTGVLMLKSKTTVSNCVIKPVKGRWIFEPIEDKGGVGNEKKV